MQLRADNSALSERMKTVKAAMDELQAVKEEGEAALRKLLQPSQRLLREATGDLDACRRETSQHLEKRENDFGEEIHALCLANDHLGTKQRSEERERGARSEMGEGGARGREEEKERWHWELVHIAFIYSSIDLWRTFLSDSTCCTCLTDPPPSPCRSLAAPTSTQARVSGERYPGIFEGRLAGAGGGDGHGGARAEGGGGAADGADWEH